MVGVEIINTIYEYERVIDPLWALSFGCICFVLGVIGMCTVYYDVIQKWLIRIIIPFVLAMLVCFAGATIKTDKVAEIQYEVIVTDEVSIEEFNSRYEIVGQRSENIFLVKER